MTRPPDRFVPLNKPDLGDAEEKSVVEALRSGWVTTGSRVRDLESEFAAMIGRTHALAVSSGTTALEAALIGVRVGPGDGVLTQGYVCDAVANAVHRVTHRAPVVVDIEPETWSLDAEHVKVAVMSRPPLRAVILAHTYGTPARDLIEIADICRLHRVPLIEDCSEAHGASLDGRPVGSFGDVAIWSLRGEKTVSGGQLGIVLSDDAAVMRRAKRYVFNGLPSDAVRFWSSVPGVNGQPSNLNAALACAQLARLDELRSARNRINAGWRQRLFQHVDFQGWRGDPCWWLTAIILDRFTRLLPQDFAVALRERGIESRTAFYGLHLLPHCQGSEMLPCPVTEGLMTSLLILPSGPGITEDDQDYVCEQMFEIVGRR